MRTMFLTAAAALGFALPAAAATIPFDATVDNGIYDGFTASGELTFDETLLTGMGWERITVSGLEADYADPTLSISFAGGPVSFDETNDIDYPDFPGFLFYEGELAFVAFAVESGTNGVDLVEPYGVIGFSFAELNLDTDGRAAIDVIVEYVPPPPELPLPASAPMLLIAVGGLGLARRFRRS